MNYSRIDNFLKSQDNKLNAVAKNFKKLITSIKIWENKENIGHLITRTIIKKKRECINTYSDLRCISIVPSLILVPQRKKKGKRKIY